jgi:FlaA1/EpsC-like NDP-sugar epimerase
MKIKFFMNWKETKAEGLYLSGIIMLVPPLFSSYFAQSGSLNPYSLAPLLCLWLGIILILLGTFKKFGFNRTKWNKIFTKQHYFRFLSILTQTLLIFYIMEFINQKKPFLTFTLLITCIIIFYLCIYLEDISNNKSSLF